MSGFARRNYRVLRGISGLRDLTPKPLDVRKYEITPNGAGIVVCINDPVRASDRKPVADAAPWH